MISLLSAVLPSVADTIWSPGCCWHTDVKLCLFIVVDHLEDDVGLRQEGLSQ